jgi:hypothetical protein
MASPEQAAAWHEAGVANGGTAIEDPPGLRGQTYLACLRDPDGNSSARFIGRRLPERSGPHLQRAARRGGPSVEIRQPLELVSRRDRALGPHS